MGQMTECKMTEYLMAVNNRLSNAAFAAGMAANLIAQLAMFNMDNIGASDYSEVQQYSAFWTFIFNVYAYFTAEDWFDIGYITTTFLAYLVNYTIPGISTQPEAM